MKETQMKTTRNLLTLFVVTALVLPLAGCGGEILPDGMAPPVPTEIVVMQDGRPLEGAGVVLQPVDNSPWTAVGLTDAAGRAIVYTMDRHRGAVPGQYKVLVRKTEQEDAPILSSEEANRLAAEGRLSAPSSFNLVDTQFGAASTTPLEIEAVRGTSTHTVDVGAAVRIRIP